MSPPLDKARTNRAQLSALIDNTATRLHHALRHAYRGAANDEQLAAKLARGDWHGALKIVENFIAGIGAMHRHAFTAVGNARAPSHNRKLTKATPTIAVRFSTGNLRAARRMRASQLEFIQGLTQRQREATRRALAEGIRRGLGTNELALRVRQSIGLNSQEVTRLETLRRSQLAARAEAMALPEAERGIVSSLPEIERLIEADRRRASIAGSQTIARTEALRVTSLADDEALRQSLESTGQSASLTGKEWAATHDSATRPAHDLRDGARRRLDDSFAPGIYRPGDGPAHESISCRCVLMFEFFDTEAELKAWLGAGT